MAVDPYRDKRFRCGSPSSNPVFDWASVPGALTDTLSPVNQNTIVDGAAVTSWVDSIGGVNWTPDAVNPTYDVDGVNGHPGVRYTPNAFSVSNPQMTPSIIGTQPGDWEIILTTTIVAVPDTDQPFLGVPLTCSQDYRCSMKAYRQIPGDGLIYVVGQIFNPIDTFQYVQALIGSTLPARVVIDWRRSAPTMAISVNGGTEATASNNGPQNSANVVPWFLSLEAAGAPVYANQVVSRQMTRGGTGNGTRTMAAIISELARTA